MLKAVIAAYPDGLTREKLGATAGIAATSGTFSTYLSKLRSNGLVESHNGIVTATDILMHATRR